MQLKNIIDKCKRINHKHVLALCFLIYIFYVSVAALPSTLKSLVKGLNGNDLSILTIRDEMDEAYRGMLDFKGAPPANKGAYINLNGFMARQLGQCKMNERIKLSNGHLTSVAPRQEVAPAVVELTKLFQRQLRRGKTALFVLAPHQVSKYEDDLPAGYEDYANENSDNLLQQLKENGIPVLDLREEMQRDGISYADAFFKTDHHWKPKTGFYAYKKLVDYFTQMGIIAPIESKYTDLAAFHVENYENWFLGSAGKRTGQYYAGVDDFSIISPEFETSLSLYLPSNSLLIEGNFLEVGFDMAAMRQDFFGANPYAGFGHSDRDHKQYRNEFAPVDLKVLSIADSFGNVPLTFLPLVFQSCDELDMRYYDGVFEEYYQDYDPDILIVLISSYSPAQDNTMYHFFED